MKMEEQIEKIKLENWITPTDILKATPFDKEKDLNRLLNEELFYKEFHYENNNSKQAKIELLNDLKSARKKLGVNFFNFWEKFCVFFSDSRNTPIKMGLIQ